MFTESAIEEDQKSNRSLLSSRSKLSTLAFIKAKLSPSSQKKKKSKKENEQKQQTISQLVKLREDELNPEERKLKEELENMEENHRQERDFKLKQIQEEEDRIRKKKEEEEEKQRTYQETKKALKNREFTYDYNGRIVLVKGLRSENLPQDVPLPTPDVNLNNPVVVERIAYEKIGIKIPEYRKFEPTEPSQSELSAIVDPKQARFKQRPQTAGKQRIIIQKNSQSQQKRPQSGANLNNGLQKRQNTTLTNKGGASNEQNDEKLHRQQSLQKLGARKKSEQVETFFPKQVQIYDLFNPASGVGIKFSNGVRKTGGEITKPNRMKKADYDKMIENQPKLSYIEERQQCIENENKSIKEQQNEKEIQEHMDELKKSQNALSLKNKLAVKIMEEDQYVKMIQTQICSNYPRQLIQQQISQSKVSSKASISTKKQGKKVIKIERITAYPKQNILTELPLINVQDKQKLTKAQKLMNKFNENEILKNPNWGEKNFALEQSSISSKEGFYSNATNFRQRREVCTKQNRPMSSKFRSSSLGQASMRPKSAVKYQQIIEQKESLIESKLSQMQD